MVNTHSTTHNQPSRLTPSVMARKQQDSPQPIQNPPFLHRYDNLPKRLSDTPRPSPARAPWENPGDPDPGPPNNEGNGDNNDSNNSNQAQFILQYPNQDPNPNLNLGTQAKYSPNP